MGYEGLNSIEGIQFVPVNELKRPLIKDWQKVKKKHNLNSAWGVGIVCGSLSGNIECLDIDLKYSLDSNFYDKLKGSIHKADPTLLSKLVVQKTQNGGYHFIYRCEKVAGNLKLANRPTTPEEKKDTYEKTYQAEIEKSTNDEKARQIAEKASENDKCRTLIETRGIGGQFVCHPSPGYDFVFGDIFSINEITIEQREILHSISMGFNEYFEEIIIPKNKLPKVKGLSPFDDYNQRGDIVALLQDHGWQVVKNKGKKTIFLRPGQTHSESSGNFDHERNWFSVFTTSTEFEPQKAYLPYAVFALLECKNDFSEAARRLLDMGYGEKKENNDKPKESTRVIKSRINPEDNDYSFLATSNDYNDYLQQIIDGTLPQGLTTGSPKLDEHFLLKEGNLVIINGVDNVGKSVWIWWLMLVAALYHGWKGLIFSSENTLGSFMRKMIQFYWGKPLYGNFAMTSTQYQIAKKFVEDHFLLIKAQEDLFNYKDIINMAKKSRIKWPSLKYALIDPYNSLKIDLSGFSKLSTHEYHYEATSEIKAYGQQTNFGWFLNMHAITTAARQKDGEKKYPVAPRKEDTEGGQKFANKADDFLTIHRITQHPTDWMITEVHVRKIKDTETGGRPTTLDEPVKFEMYKGGCGFIERRFENLDPIDPIEKWHSKNKTIQPDLIISNGIGIKDFIEEDPF